MKITVTEKHIRSGVRGSCSSDPICLALKEAGFMRPWVSPDYIRTDGFNGGFMREEWRLPDNVLIFLKEYDNGVVCFPFEFELEGY